MQITADSIGVYAKVFSLSPYQNVDVIRQWSVQWCLMSGPSCLLLKNAMITFLGSIAWYTINVTVFTITCVQGHLNI